MKPEQILFYEIENHGFSLNTNPAPIDKNDLPNALEVIKRYRADLQSGKQTTIDEEKYYTILKQKILENASLNLTGGVHREKSKGSHDEWPMVELGEVLDYEQPTNYIVSIEDYNDKYKTPVLTAGKTFILGYTSEKEGIFKDNLPVIIFDDFTAATKLVDFSFKVKSSAMKILHAKKEQANIKFLFYMMQQIKFNSSTHKRYWISEYSKITIPLPPIEIQEQIVAELESYQKVIDGARIVVENWKPSFEIGPEWKVEKLENVSEMVRGPFGGSLKKEIFKPTGYLVYEQYHAINADFNFARYFIDEKKIQEMKRFEVFAGDILVSCSGTMGKIAVVPNDYKKGIINQALLKLTPNKTKILGRYLKLALESETIQQKHFRNQSGVAIPNVASVKVLSQIEIPLPPIETQKQIVAKIEEEQKIVEANTKLIGLFQQKIEAKIKSIYES